MRYNSVVHIPAQRSALAESDGRERSDRRLKDGVFHEDKDIIYIQYKYKDMRELESGERLKYIPLDGRLNIK